MSFYINKKLYFTLEKEKEEPCSGKIEDIPESVFLTIGKYLDIQSKEVNKENIYLFH